MANFGKKRFITTSSIKMLIRSEYPPVPVATEPFHETLRNAFRKHMDSENETAFVCAETNTEVSFKTIHDLSYAVASFLHKNNFRKDVACMVMPNHWVWAPFFLGVAMNGGTLSGINIASSEDEIRRQFLDSHAKVVLTNKETLPKVLKVSLDSPYIEHVICVQDEPGKLPSGVHCWKRDVLSTSTETIPNVDIDVEKDAVFMPYSSGTTGIPKGVMISHQNFGTMMNIFRQHDDLHMAGAVSFNPIKEKSLMLLPFYHCYGFALVMSNLLRGNAAVVMEHFQPELFCESIQRHRIRFIAVAPPVLVFLTKSPICKKYDLSSLEFVMCGAAPVGRDLCEDFLQMYKHVKYMQQGYGMSEATMATHLPDAHLGQPFGSVGKIVSNLEMKIVDPETGNERSTGEIGEICVRGPTVMLGYFQNVEATENCIKDGWLHTGDLGYVDDDNYLFIVDRLKELIKVKGFQVPPAELEGILLSHPEIRDAAVIAVPHAEKGEVPRAYVVSSSNSLREDDVKNFVSDKVSAYKRLDGGVEFVDSIPKSPAGKILRRILRDRHRSKL
ncbi:hypothetical protein V3C99_011746 [Haemonchus contortus]|nr:AMP-dependent synthetase ligase domain containing protein [Haemonchus contortus]